MKKSIGIGLAILVTASVVSSQEVRLRSLNEVVFGFYEPWDEEQLQALIPVNFLHEDIDMFVQTIEEINVNPYINFPREAFYREVNALKQRIDAPSTRKDFLRQVVPVVNKLKQSHTKVSPDYWVYQNIYNESGGTYIPIDVRIENARLFVKNDYSRQGLGEGDEVFSINNINAHEIIENLLSYSSNSTTYSKTMDIQDNFSFWFWWGYNRSDTFRIRTTKGSYTVDGLTAKEIDERRAENLVQEVNEEYKQYEYSQIDAVTGKLTFRDFGIRDTASYHCFLDSVFCQLKSNALQNLIIDVRANVGGNDQCVEIVKYIYDKPFKSSSKVYYKKSKTAEDFFRLFAYPENRDDPTVITYINESVFGSCEAGHRYGEYYECDTTLHEPKPDSIRFTGKVFVLSDYKTTSSGVDFVVLIKDYGIGTVIGSETNQSPSNDANGVYFLLPHTNVMGMGATMYAIRPNGDPDTSSGVIPDYKVTQLKEDTDKGDDTVMDFAMKLIHK